MNKFTKLLSVFVIAGAVSAGVATLAGCATKHTGEKHEAVAATCTQTGTREYYTCDDEGCKGKYFSDAECKNEVTLESLTIAALGHSATKTDAKAATCTATGNNAYYTCSGSECAGKYYSDEACTTEVTLENITIAALGHSYGAAVDNNNGSHSSTCATCGDVVTGAHVDENDDATCDDCAAKFFAPGKYYNLYYTTETLVEIKAGGIVVFNGQEYALSAVSEENVATFTADQEYTLTKTETGYTLSYGTKSKDLVPVPEIYAEDVVDLAGVYEVGSTYVYYDSGSYFKLLSLSITEDEKVIYSAIQVNEDGTDYEGAKAFTRSLDASSVDVLYNTFSVYPINFTVTADKGAKIELYFGYDSTKFVEITKTAAAAPVVPESMKLTDFTQYVDAEESYTFLVGANNVYSLNGKSVYLVGGNATEGYLVQTYDASYNYISYVIKVNTTNNTLDLYDVDGTTKLATLAVKEQAIPVFKVNTDMETPEVVFNNSALVDVFNSNYALYKIETSGWYYFYVEENFTFYTSVENHEPSVMEGVVKTYAGFAPAGVELKAGDIIAIPSDKAETAVAAYVSETNIDSELVKEFTGFTEEQYGTYSYDYTDSWGYPETITFVISAEGITYNGYAADVVAYDGYSAYAIDLWGDAITFYFNGDNNIAVVYDEFSDQNDYVAVKGGTSGGEEGGEDYDDAVYVTAGDNEVVINPMTYGSAEITLNRVGVWTVTFGSDVSYILVGTSPKVSGSTIEVTDTPIVITVYANYDETIEGYPTSVNVNFELTSGSGEEISSGEEDTGLKVGENTINVTDGETAYTFTVTEAGDYVITYGSAGWVMIEDAYGAESVSSGDTLTLSAGETVTFLCSMYDYSLTGTFTLTITKEGGEEATGAVVGENTVQAGMSGSVDIEFSVPGTYTLTYDSEADNVYYIMVGGTMVWSGNNFTVTDSVTITVYASDNSQVSKFTITVAEAEGGEETGTTLALGENTINATFAGVEYTFTATEAGDYTITFDGDSFIMSNDESFSSGTTVTLTAGQSLVLVCCSNVGQTATYTLTITKEGGEEVISVSGKTFAFYDMTAQYSSEATQAEITAMEEQIVSIKESMAGQTITFNADGTIENGGDATWTQEGNTITVLTGGYELAYTIDGNYISCSQTNGAITLTQILVVQQ